VQVTQKQFHKRGWHRLARVYWGLLGRAAERRHQCILTLRHGTLIGALATAVVGAQPASAQEMIQFNSTGGGNFNLIGQTSGLNYGTLSTSGNATANPAYISNQSLLYTTYPSFFSSNVEGPGYMRQILNFGQTINYTFTFSTTVVSPDGLRLHIQNLDSATWKWNYTGFGVVSKNDEMDLFTTATTTQFNTPGAAATNVGCELNDGTNPNGACGTFNFTPTAGQVITAQAGDVPFNFGDGFSWTLEANTIIPEIDGGALSKAAFVLLAFGLFLAGRRRSGNMA
jgi:hypothetical protein